MNMIASCKRRDDLLAEYITLTECSYNRSLAKSDVKPTHDLKSQRRQHEQKERNRQVS